MSLDLAVLLAESEDEERLLRALTAWEPTGHTVSADLEGPMLAAVPALGTVHGWALLVDPALALALDPVVAGLATRAGRGVAAAFQPSTDTYVFDVYEEGLKVRGQVRTAGRAITDDGQPLPQESGIDWQADGEEALAALVARITGIDLLSPDLTAMTLRTLRRRPTLR